MPPKKSTIRSRSSKGEVKQPKIRSTALIFVNEEDVIKLEEDEKADDNPQAVTEEEYDDPSSYPFPLNYIYIAQDFLNENLSYSRSVELLVSIFLLQISYVGRKELGLKDDELYLIGYNLFGTIVGLITSYRAQMKKYDADQENYVKPPLPAFNHIYSVLLPLYFNIIFKSKYFLLNLCLNYYIIDNFQVFMKVILGVLFFHLFNEDENVTILTFLQAALGYYLISLFLDYINEGSLETIHEVSDEVLAQDSNVDLTLIHNHSSGDNKSLSKPEIHLISVMIINLFLSLESSYGNLPLVIFQKLFFVFVSALMLVYPIYAFNKERKNIVLTGIILVAFSGIFYYLTVYLLEPILKKNPVIWLIEYIMSSQDRKNILTLWLVSLLIFVPIIFALANKLTLNVKRKIWHFILVALVTPGLKFEPEFTLISLLGALIVFIVIEMLRLNKITFVGRWLSDILIKFQDFKDLKGPLNLSYIYLLFGSTLPVLLEYTYSRKVTEKSYLGLVSLGVGDSMASLYGKKFGKLRWALNSKSIDGSIVYILSCLFVLKGIEVYALASPVKNWENLIVTILLGAIVEGASSLNDNFLIPAFSYVSYELLERIFV